MEKHHHSGHRDRVRQRFLKEGITNFEEHQILEMLLFYAVPRRDTNEMAHRLLMEFGSLKALLEADAEMLSRRMGISINTAVLISLVGGISERCKTYVGKYELLDTVEKAKKFFLNILGDKKVEFFYIACLDNKKRLIKLIKVGEGNHNSIAINLSKVLMDISYLNASYVVCSHNHPNGVEEFSSDDIKTTYTIMKTLAQYGVSLMDHILVCNGNVISLSENKKFTF